MRTQDMPYGPAREKRIVTGAYAMYEKERRARNIMATLALVGWVLALAALGGAV